MKLPILVLRSAYRQFIRKQRRTTVSSQSLIHSIAESFNWIERRKTDSKIDLFHIFRGS